MQSNRAVISVGIVLVAVGLVYHYHHHHLDAESENKTLAHTRNSFSFVVRAPLAQAAPLFGAEGERRWAGEEWNPKFFFPRPAQDVEGAVFQVSHGHHHQEAVWVNTSFDLEAGRMQYVYFLPDVMVTKIDVKLTPLAETSIASSDTTPTSSPASSAANLASPMRPAAAPATRADVTYERTALESRVNSHVEAMGRKDAGSGPEWQTQMDQYLSRSRPAN